MKLVKEAYKLLSSDPFKSILLIIQLSGFIILFNISLGTVHTANLLSDKVVNTSLNNAYYYSYGTAKIQENSYNGILNDVEFQSYFRPVYGDREITAYCYSESCLEECPLKLTNGTKTGNLEKNECLISYDLSETFNLKKGEQVKLMYNGSLFVLTVKGIIHRDEQINKFTVTGNNLSLKTIYTKPKNMIILTSCEEISKSDMSILPCGIYKNTAGLTEREVKEKFSGYGEIASFGAMLEEERAENKSIILLFSSLSAVLLAVTFINITANNFLILKLQEKRFAIYFLCGMSLGDIYKIISLRSVILSAISYVISFASITFINGFSFVDEFSFNAATFIASLAIAASMTAVSEIPLYIKISKTEPIRLFKESLR